MIEKGLKTTNLASSNVNKNCHRVIGGKDCYALYGADRKWIWGENSWDLHRVEDVAMRKILRAAGYAKK